MIRIALSFLGLTLLLQASALAQAPVNPAANPVDAAVDEGIRREHAKVQLGQRLIDAQTAEKKGDLVTAAQAYEDCLKFTKQIGTGVEAQEKLVMDGFISVRLMLAEQALRATDFDNADRQVGRILKEYPKTEAALAMKKKIDETRMAEAGRRPTDEVIAKASEFRTNTVQAMTHVQNGKFLFEAGKLEEAEWELLLARRLDPGNKAADYYINLIIEMQHRNESLSREEWSKFRMLEVDKAWNQKIKRDTLPVPNPYARTNLVNTSKGRQAIYSKLDRIKLNELVLDSIPLSDVVAQLSAEAKNRDPDKRGLNFIINANIDPASAGPPAIDPATGIPIPAQGGEAVDISAITIRLKPALTDITLHQALDAIQKVADRPIKYSVEDYAVVFSLRTPETPLLHTRTFRVDPNTFLQGLQGVIAQDFGTGSGGGGGGGGRGGGGGGGGGRGGGGGGGRNSGGGGNQGNQGGQSSGGGAEYVGVSLAAGGGGQRRGNQAGGAAGGQQRAGGAGAAGQQAQGGGIRNLTAETQTQEVIDIVRQFFTAAGVLLDPPKTVFFNERQGMLMVRATLQDLDTIEQAVQVLNISPPQVTIEAKFAEVTQEDNRALGFDWFWGNTLIGGDKIAAQGGTAPTYGGPQSASPANPSGYFPGPGLPASPGNPAGSPGAGAIAAAATDNILTSGLRNSAGAPALATLTGILTDPQFRLVIRALEQRQGVDVLASPKVTTLSSRQAQIKAVDIRYIVTDLDLGQTSSGGSQSVATPGVATGGGVVGSTIQPIAEPFELGPVLDVVPYVSADGFTVQLTIIPTTKEFIGYDLESAKLFSAQAQSVGNAAAPALTTTTPLPIFRLRQVVTSAVVWDGQTVVIGGLISESVMKMKDKVPVLGDLPFVGRLFRSESSLTKKKNLLIFVTPTIIDPAGNRMHSEEEMPFAQNAIPPQTPLTK